MIPVIAPIGKDERGENTYNINADNAAAVIAKALKAEKLVYLTDVEGLLTDVEDSTSLVSVIKISDLEYDKRTSTQLLKGCEISGGMIPKVDCCAYAIKNGVKNVHILDGRVEHSLLLEIFTEKGIGTMFEE
jgi:acetylglutamate kinase